MLFERQMYFYFFSMVCSVIQLLVLFDTNSGLLWAIMATFCQGSRKRLALYFDFQLPGNVLHVLAELSAAVKSDACPHSVLSKQTWNQTQDLFILILMCSHFGICWGGWGWGGTDTQKRVSRES